MEESSSMSWKDSMKEFAISEYGGFSNQFMMNALVSGTSEKKPKISRARPTARKEYNRVVSSGTGDFSFCVESRCDFIQSLAGADETHINHLMSIFTDIITRGCHHTRISGGDVELHLDGVKSRWKKFSVQCVGLGAFCKERKRLVHEEREKKRKHEEDVIEEKRKRVRAMILHRGTGNENSEGGEEEEEDEYHSSLLKEIKRTPDEIYKDTKNIRICVLFCMLAKSKNLQNLVCLGRIVSESRGCKLEYVPIPKTSLEEFIAFTKSLRNAFMTAQTSARNCVKCIRDLVERGGVHSFTIGILKKAREEETKRLSSIL